jgi:hypothetical protein
MQPQTTKDQKATVISSIEVVEVELDLEELEEVIAPAVGPCNRR